MWWSLIDFKEQRYDADNKAYFSTTYYYQGDCNEYKTKVLSGIWYAGNIGQGGIVSSYDATPHQTEWLIRSP